MKVLLSGVAVAVVLAIAIGYFLSREPDLAWQTFSTPSTRVDDPGSNLVGPQWTGENDAGEAAEGDNPT